MPLLMKKPVVSVGKKIKFQPNNNDHHAEFEKKPLKRSLSTSERSVVSSGTTETEIIDERIVTFNEKIDQIKILSRKDYTKEEKNACWFQPKEMAKIADSCVKQATKMERGQVLKDKKFCSRGLEQLTLIGGIAKLRNRHDSIDAVLDEQDYQITSNGFVDEDSIAYLYEQITSSSLLWARTVALRDQREAENFLDM